MANDPINKPQSAFKMAGLSLNSVRLFLLAGLTNANTRANENRLMLSRVLAIMV